MTTTTTTTQTLSILADYEVHHSGNDNHDEHEHASPITTRQPTDWPTDHRRMPAYRPTNRNLPFEERPGGSNPAEMVFIQVMLNGVWLNAAVSRLWRFTGGRINDKIFHYDVGGEW
ncbi:hypothetical protein N7467_002096 [Penicillium canescens]|nr:hypothetical protein N7467_002096 [Penicillium canescens]